MPHLPLLPKLVYALHYTNSTKIKIMKNMLLAAAAAGTFVAGSILYLRRKKELGAKKMLTNGADAETLPTRAHHAMG
jgi:hypothetical protein